MAETIAICNQKGGVGKTTTAVNLGIGLAREGYRVLMVDADSQGHLTTHLGWRNHDTLTNTLASLMQMSFEKNIEIYDVQQSIMRHGEEVDVLAGSLTLASLELYLVDAGKDKMCLRNILKVVSDEYDYIIIDCQSSFGMMTINALNAADKVIIPAMPEYLSTSGTKELLSIVYNIQKHTNSNLDVAGILITRADMRCRRLTPTVISSIRDTVGKYVNVYKNVIPNGADAIYASAEGKSVYAHNRQCKVSKAYENLVKEVLNNGRGLEKELKRDF